MIKENLKKVVGVDLGGTQMRAALLINGVISEKAVALVPKTDDEMVVINALIDTIKKVYTPEVEGIGIGVPSLVGLDTGIVYDVQNIQSWKKIYLKDILSREFNCPIYINNDANCFAMGERVFGEGQNYDDFVGLITGTGLGAGIIKNGHLVSGENCGAGEFGMIEYLDNTYEYYCSGQFFTNCHHIEGSELVKKAAKGDSQALEIFNEYGRHLGRAIKTILFSVDPAAIILGGSVSKSFQYYKDAMWKEILVFPYQCVLENIKIITSETEEIAILGAAALCVDAIS